MDRRRSAATIRWGLALALLVLPSWTRAQAVQNDAGASMVRAVLFYSPTCPHCEELIRVTLPPMLERYGDRLDMVGISIATRSGSDMYRTVVEHFVIPESRQGVPTLVIGSTVLVGGTEIPSNLPGLIDRALASDGIDWPPIPAMRASLQAQGLIPPPQDSAARPRTAEASRAAPDPATLPGTRSRDSMSTGAGARGGAVVPESRGDPRGVSDTAARSNPARRADSAGLAVPPDPRPQPATPEPRPDRAEPVAEGAPPPPNASGSAGDTAVTAPSAAPMADAAVIPADSSAAAAFTRDLGRDLGVMTMADRFRLDPAGNSAAVAVLILLGAVLLFTVFSVLSPARRPSSAASWMVPALAVAGMAVAAYLAWVEVTGAEAVCGPVGDCNTVQQSVHARLFGVPVGLLGLAGYAAILASWLLSSRASGRHRRIGRVMVWSMALVATLFSTYLTFLEPFVIGATCAWCLSSSVIAASVLLLTTPTVRHEIRPSPGAER